MRSQRRKEIVMLERYFVRPATVDRIRASWIGKAVERYVEQLADSGYAERSIHYRVPLLIEFGEFAHARGARTWPELAFYAEDFIAERIRRGCGSRGGDPRPGVAKEIRGPVEHFLRLIAPGFIGHVRQPHAQVPFASSAPDFFRYLSEERGLRPATLWHYGHHLRRFEHYLRRISLHNLCDLTPAVLAAFVADCSPRMGKTVIRDLCGTLRVLLRYLHREQMLPRDLSISVDAPHAYRLSHIPRSVTWEEVRKMLSVVARRLPRGKRDYAILLLLVTYGLRAREVAALMLDHIDWKRERLHVPERKADHATAYPLSTIVGDAIVDYLQHGRPKTTDRHLFFRCVAPYVPLTYSAISCRASHYLRKAGIPVSRAGSHTLRHTCVQRLVDADFSLKVIGDYVGHRVPASTEIYSKVAVEALRKVALGDGEEIV
jgi:integrase/recombinase XerD